MYSMPLLQLDGHSGPGCESLASHRNYGLGRPRLRSQRLQPMVIANYLMIGLEGPTQFGLFKLPAFG